MSNSKPRVNLKLLEGRSFTIGRHGHIFIDSITASNRHAEIKIVDQKIHLRDLDSTNGTFLVGNGSKRRFKKGFVKPAQRVEIGGEIRTIAELLSIATDFAALGGAKTEIRIPETSQKRVIGK